MREFKLRQRETKEKVALLNDTALELQERGLQKEVEFHFSEAYRLLKELARDHEAIALTSKRISERTSERLISLSDQAPSLFSNIGSSCPRLAQPIFVRDLALGSNTCVPTLAAVLMYNTGLIHFRRGNLKKADIILRLAYSSVERYNKNKRGNEQFLVQATILILDLLGRIKISRSSHECCEQHKRVYIADGLQYHIQSVELGRERFGAQHVLVGVCLAAFADDLARTGYLYEAMQGFTEACNVLTSARSLSEVLERELESQIMYPAAPAA
jgi:tetratricopeptide (TPR) repeat protein